MRAILPLVAALALCQSCIFEYPDPDCVEDPWRHVRVVFDTSLCPDASPEGMAVFFYPSDGTKPWRFDFSGTRGGVVDLPSDDYSVIAYNNDTYRTVIVDPDTYDRCSFTTPPTGIFSEVGPLTRTAIPGIAPDGTEDVLRMPQMMWCASLGRVDTSADSLVTLALHQAVANIHVEINDVANLDDVAQLSAIITGMPAGYSCSRLEPTGGLAAIPFGINRPDAASQTLVADLMAFPQRDGAADSYVLLYIWLVDGERFYFKFDVTEQLREAADPLNVDIRLGPITIPEATGNTGSGGMDVGVDGWDYVIIDMESS